MVQVSDIWQRSIYAAGLPVSKKTNMADGSEDFVSGRSISTITDQFEMMDDDTNIPLDNMDILNLEDTEKSAATSRSGSSHDSSQYSYDSPGGIPDVLEDSEQNDREQLSIDGVLDEETIEQGLSNLGRSADGTQQVFLHLSIPGYRLRDISLLGEYIHLQKVEIPYNEITDLSPLSNMPYLLELNASHNQLTTLLDFKPPNNLKIVDVSYNEINEMADLSAHHYLVKLVIDNNNISEIKGIEKCTRLKHLSLAHNQIENIKGLTGLPLTYLNLSFNKLTKIENLETLKLLRTIDLSGNQIRSMNGLQDHEFLESIDFEINEIIDLAEVQYIRPLTLVRELNLQRNPIRELPDYRLSVIYYLQQLTELDRKKVEVDEKVSASNMFNPPMEVLAARDHIMHVIYSFIQPSRVLDSTLPSIDTPYPMLVLVGPQGAGKADLAQKLVEEFSDYFGYGITHTTRRPFTEERQGKDHHFVTLEEFEESIKMGRFLYTYSYHGDLYGLTLDAIETVARDGLACVVVMEIEGVLTLKNTHFEPRYVLVLPMSSDVHERRLREQGTYTEMQIQMTLARDELYANYNREHPGFFDVMIASDDIIEAYKQLRRLIMEYLGINAPSPSISDVEPSNGGSVLEKEGTMDTLTGQSNLVRQWSKLSITDSLSQAINSLKVKSAPSPMPTTGRGIVEELSLRRRESAAKQTASGHQPTIYEQLLQNAPRTVPLPVSDQVGLGEERHEPRSHSAPMSKNENMDALPPSSPDSSLSGDGDGTSLSDISEACDMERDDPIPQEGSPKGSEEDFDLPSEAVDMIDMLSASGSKNFPGSVPLAPRPGSGSCQVESPRSNASGSRSNSRLGSERHRVLPPITA